MPTSTFVSAILSGMEQLDHIHDWVDIWRRVRSENECVPHLNAFLGFSAEQLERWLIDPGSLREILAEHGFYNPDVREGPLQIRHDVPLDLLESRSPGRSICVICDDRLISVALTPPPDTCWTDPVAINEQMRALFEEFVKKGWKIDIQVGHGD